MMNSMSYWISNEEIGAIGCVSFLGPIESPKNMLKTQRFPKALSYEKLWKIAKNHKEDKKNKVVERK